MKKSTLMIFSIILMSGCILLFSCGEDATAPLVKTDAVTSIQASAAVFNGEVTSDGGDPVTARGFVYNTSPNPTIENNHAQTEDGTGTGVFTHDVAGLLPSVNFYVRAYATNLIGTTYGEEVIFQTSQ